MLTAADQTTQDVAALSGGQDQLTIILLAFAVVAIIVTALVISNTFSVLVAQRTRELALLRCIGAGRGQIRNSVLVEAAIMGLVSSVFGVLLAAGVMWVLVEVARNNPGSEFATLAVPPSAVIAGIAVGLLMTLAAAFVPARAATAVAPLEELRPADYVNVSNRRGKFRLIGGGVLVIMGGALLAAGAARADLLMALPGGAMSFLGVLLCASLFIPALVSGLGRLAEPLGVPGRLAAVNAVRNPARTTATATALVVGVTLVTMMMAGAQTSRTAFEDTLAQNYPVDLSIQLEADRTATALETLASIEGVEAAAALTAVATTSVESGERTVYTISGSDAEAVLRSAETRPVDDIVLMPEDSGLPEITIDGASGSKTLPVREVESRTLVPLISEATAERLGVVTDPASQGSEVWLKLDDSLDYGAVTALRTEIVETLGLSDYQVSGAALERATFNQIIDVLLLVVTALLAVAVFIALIGVANTLSLSVLERTRESSLLRALGLTRAQLRIMLAVEAVLVAGVSALLGTALGILYGWLGAQAALGSVAAVTPSIPWLQLAGVLLVAVVAGLIASVMPARRAARLSPVEGLAMG
ncbi:ABC transporter permease [Arthrobacter sp. H5]|uniref:FtsX-like permease family protein n=1 Tax=Arthrobacter sp. H5 TaxID=1267973 RepID=UPI0004B56659|nr:ABC transporter permease [Arthrobacter sp. H5]